MIGRVRPYDPSSDEDGVVYLWLKSFAHSRYGRSLGAHVTHSDAELAYWSNHRRVVMRLLAEAKTEVVCDPEAESVIWAFATTSGPDVVHYVCCKRTFHREGLSAEMIRQLLGDRLERPCIVTHELVELGRTELRGKVVVPQWQLDPYWLARAWGGSFSEASRPAA